MGTSPAGQSEYGWTLSQRRALLALLMVLLAFLVVRYAINRAYVSDPQPAQGSRSAELASRIDPNSATWEELAAIPSLGEKRSRAIIDYRDAARLRNPAEIVFRSADDLMRVRGIGRATADNLKPYLIFPGERPATRP